MCGGFVSHELETQAGPSRLLLEISLLEHNRLEGENEDRMQNNADTSCGDREREREERDLMALTLGFHS